MNLGEKISGKIKHIQSLPEKEKARVIWILAIIITAILAVIWFGFLRNYGISNSGGGNKVLEDMKKNLKKQFKDKFGGKLEIPKIEIPKIEIPKNVPQGTLPPSI